MGNPLKRWSLPSGGVYNMRDVGGLACAYGVTRYGVLLRSDAPCNLTQEDKAFLLNKGLTTVVDMRSQGEMDVRPGSFTGDERVTLFTPNLEAFSRATRGDSASYTDMGEHYLDMADNRGSVYANGIAAVANAPGLAIVHCTAGKDRTGTLIALIELLLGVHECDIIAEYEVSYTYTLPLMELYADILNVPDYVKRSNPGSMRSFLREIECRGGAVSYLKAHGLSDTDVERLRVKLVARD